MSTIKNIFARQILDSRGIPTVEVDIITKNNIIGRASIPSGASTGDQEAFELRDGDNHKYMGKGVLKSLYNIKNIISPHIIGLSVFNQIDIDNILIELDGTKNKNKLGSNSILGISLAITKAASLELNLPLYRYIGGIHAHVLPVPMINIVNGGSHSDAGISFQEFMIIPVKSNTFSNAIRISCEIFYSLKQILKNRNLSTGLGDEGGFSPKFYNNEDAIESIIYAIESSGYKPGEDVMLALDCAASEFYKDNMYNYNIFEGKNSKILSSEEQVDYLISLTKKYPIISIEDGMDQYDINGWKLLTSKLGKYIQLVGDDLFVTSVELLNQGIKEKIANSLLVKLNQIGTLSETIDAINIAKSAKYTSIVSHRSGETEDNFISDLSVAFNTGQIKTGSVSRSERTCKYNQLIRIEEYLGKSAYYPGINAFQNINI